jgi:large subunit ribosomal protein L9
MKVILIENVKTLGNIGEIVNVTTGYARNFLFPRKLAILADKGNKRVVEDTQRRIARKVDLAKNAAIELKAKIDKVSLEFIKRVAANGKLFGSVSTTDLTKELEKLGIVVEKRLLHTETAMKALGDYSVKARLFPGVDASFSVKIVIDPKQIEELKLAQEEAIKRKEAAKLAAAEEAKRAAEAGETAPVAEGEEAPIMTEAAPAEDKSKKKGKKAEAHAEAEEVKAEPKGKKGKAPVEAKEDKKHPKEKKAKK